MNARIIFLCLFNGMTARTFQGRVDNRLGQESLVSRPQIDLNDIVDFDDMIFYIYLKWTC